MIKMTKAQALEIQDRQLAHYEQFCPGITAKVKARTTADRLEDGVEFDVVVINRHIPRGGKIEQIAGLPDMGGN
jgi:hypothetical protein